MYVAELKYESPCGFYAGPNLQWNMSAYPIDHANTLYADAYALLGFKAGYESKRGFTIFFEARNLTDQHYAAAVEPIPDARTVGGPAQVFDPGDGRSFYGGVSWALP
jgi:iron complex outermembrane receptor protein